MTLTNAFEMVQEFLYLLAYHFIYNVTYVISVCQIKYNGCVKYVKRVKNDYWVIPDQEVVEEKPRDRLLLIKNGKELCWVDPLNVGRTVLHFMNEDTGALIFAPDSNALYVSNVGVGALENHLFLSNNHCYKMDERTGEMECVLPKYTFMSILAIFKKEVSGNMPINLKRSDANYNVVGTALNAEFIKYYALKYGGDYLSFDEEYTGPIEYELQVVDGDANFFSITQRDEIVLNRLTYEVRPVT
jgi:hypothetical protein